MSGGGDPEIVRGQVAAELERELPGLRLPQIVLGGGARASPGAVRRRLRELSDAPRGGGVIAMRTHAIPQAYRACFRQLGLDPDVTRPPGEAAAVARLLHGRYQPAGLPHDALLVATIETGVGVWALDREAAGGALELRQARPGEPHEGRLVVAGPGGPCALLFGQPDAQFAVARGTREMLVYAIGVKGVPDMHLEEALWIAAELLRE